MRFTYSFLALALVTSPVVARAQQPAPASQGPTPLPQGPGPHQRGATERRPVGAMPGGPMMERMRPGGPGMMGGPSGGGIASMLLAHTAELKLTDTQLTKLAAIARRSDERHRSMRLATDSLMRAQRSQQGSAPADPRGMSADQDRASMDRMREQERTDLRDALAVLTIDQQADAWMMRGAAHRGFGGGRLRGHFGGPGGSRIGG